MTVKLLTEHNLEFLSLTGGCTRSSEATLFKMPHCWKSYVVAHILFSYMGIGLDTLLNCESKVVIKIIVTQSYI